MVADRVICEDIGDLAIAQPLSSGMFSRACLPVGGAPFGVVYISAYLVYRWRYRRRTQTIA